MRSFLSKLYLFRFLDDFILIYPVYTLMFEDNGLDMLSISSLLILWALTALILEIPSGMLADSYNRRWILLIAQMIRVVGYLCWLVAGGSYWMYLLGFVLWGAKGALMSGTFEVYVFDELKAEHGEDRYEMVLGKLKFFEYLAIGSALLLGGWFTEILTGYEYILIMSMIAVLLSALLVLSFPQPRQVRSTGETKLLQVLKAALRESWQNKKLLSVLIYLVAVDAYYGTLDEYWELYFRDLDFGFTVIGVLSFGVLLAQAIGSLLAPRINVGKQAGRKLGFITFAAGLLIGIGLFLHYGVTPVFIILGIGGITIVLVKMENQLQQTISSGQRATITSISSFLSNLTGILLFVLIGVIAQLAQLQIALLVATGLITVVGLLVALLGEDE